MTTDSTTPADPAADLADLEPQISIPRSTVARTKRAHMPRKGVRYSGPSRHAQALAHDSAALLKLAQRRNRTPAEDKLIERLARGIQARGMAFLKSKREHDRVRHAQAAASRAAREAGLWAEIRCLRRLLKVRTFDAFATPEARELARKGMAQRVES